MYRKCYSLNPGCSTRIAVFYFWLNTSFQSLFYPLISFIMRSTNLVFGLLFALLSGNFFAWGQVVAVDDHLTIEPGTFIDFGPLANDLGAINIAPVFGPSNGTVTPRPGKQLRYTPTSGFSGVDSFRYRACNSSAVCDEAMVYVAVFSGASTTLTRTTIEELLLPLYPFDFGLEDDEFEGLSPADIVLFPSNGTLSVDGDDDDPSVIQYEPNPGFLGMDTFRINICDDGDCNIYTILVNVIDSCAEALCVLPGDTNRDGIVNQDDLIGIGWSFGLPGYSRTAASISFIEQPASDWRTSVAGINSKFGDCDGNGLVSASDTTALSTNYGLVATRKLYTPDNLSTTPVPANLQIVVDTALYGDTVLAIIRIGTAAKPGVNLYGLSASLSYDFPAASSARKAIIDVSGSWLVPASDLPLTFIRLDTIARRMDFAVTRTDRAGVNGYGNVITIKLITEDNIGERPGWTGESDINLALNTGYLYEPGQPVNRLPLLTDRLVNSSPDAPGNALSGSSAIYPNPAASGGSILVPLTGSLSGGRITLFNTAGSEVLRRQFSSSGQLTLSLPELPAGVYHLQVLYGDGTAQQERLVVR